MPKIPSLAIVIIPVLINFCVLPICSSLNSPINHVYNVGDQVPFFANIVGPLNNPSETYEYYELPFCPPDQLIKKTESLAEVLNGDRLTNTRYDINFKEITSEKILCTKTLKHEDVIKFRDAVRRDFYFQMHYDDLPFWGFVGKNEGSRSYLFTHVQFEFLYNEDRVVEVHAFSHPEHVVDITDDSEVNVKFTYSTIWNASSATFATRMNRYSRASLLPPVQQVHRFSLVCSTAVFMLSVTLVVMLYRWNLKSVLRKFSTGDDDNEAGLACVDGDIFRCPPYLSLLCAVLGCGTQIFLVICCLFVLISLNIIEPYSRGTVYSSLVVIYTLTSAIAGYTAVSFHCQFAESRWETSILLTGIIFIGPSLLVFSILNTVAVLYGATSALPFGTIIVLLLIYLFFNVPFLALGGIIGHHYYRHRRSLTSKRSSREIPALTWYMRTPSQVVVGGLLPFSAVLVELHLFYASLWSYKLFVQLGVLFVTFLILVFLTSVLSIGLTHIQLSADDPRWWWRSVLRGGSTAIFMFAYSAYFYITSDMSGFMQLTYFLGINFCICYAFFLMLAAISFRASSLFTSHLCNASKRE